MNVFARSLSIILTAFLSVLLSAALAAAIVNEGTADMPPVICDTGGPDSLGYVWEDNDNGGAPVFDWIDITSIGIQVTGLGDDNNVGPVSMGFEFPYYGYTVNQMWIGSNGYISFSSNVTFAHPFAGIPSPGLPNDLVAILAGDLDFNQGNGECWYYTNGIDSFVISYLNVREFGDDNSSHTFQAIFAAADSSIKFQYGPNVGTFLDSNGEHLTLIGIENATGQVGLEYLHNNLPLQRLWHINLAIEFRPGPALGLLTGFVTDLQLNPIAGAIVWAGLSSDSTGIDGSYYLGLYPSTYSVTAAAEFHNPVTIDGIVISAGDTTFQDFNLPTPIIMADTSIIQLEVEIGDTASVVRNFSNIGDGLLEFYIRTVYDSISPSTRYSNELSTSYEPLRKISILPDIALNSTSKYFNPAVTDFQDSIFALDLEFLGDNQLLGIEFDGAYFWITGANNGGNPNKLYKLDSQGNYISEFIQPTTGVWGWRDLAFDGEFLYGSEDDFIDQIDPATGNITGVTINGPENPNRALAYDAETGHFFTANFDSPIYEFDRSGNIINTWANTKDIYGMAFDDISSGGPYLWIFSQDGIPQMQISQFNLFAGIYTGLSWQCALPAGNTDGIAGGACISSEWDPAFSALFLLGQGTPHDFIYGYEMAAGVNWVITNPRYGSLQPGQDLDINISIDFTGSNIVTDSTYTAELIIDNNSLITPVISIAATAVIILYESAIHGTVTDTVGNPINGVTVSAVGTNISNVTDSLGRYSLDSLSEGSYDIAFSHPIYWDTTASDVFVTEKDTIDLNMVLYIQDACEYHTGDINSSGEYNGLDITYGVNYFKGNNQPMCDFCPLCENWIFCGDVNGSCSYNGLDITYGVSFLKGGPSLIFCPDCPPVE